MSNHISIVLTVWWGTWIQMSIVSNVLLRSSVGAVRFGEHVRNYPLENKKHVTSRSGIGQKQRMYYQKEPVCYHISYEMLVCKHVETWGLFGLLKSSKPGQWYCNQWKPLVGPALTVPAVVNAGRDAHLQDAGAPSVQKLKSIILKLKSTILKLNYLNLVIPKYDVVLFKWPKLSRKTSSKLEPWWSTVALTCKGLKKRRANRTCCIEKRSCQQALSTKDRRWYE